MWNVSEVIWSISTRDILSETPWPCIWEAIEMCLVKGKTGRESDKEREAKRFVGNVSSLVYLQFFPWGKGIVLWKQTAKSIEPALPNWLHIRVYLPNLESQLPQQFRALL